MLYYENNQNSRSQKKVSKYRDKDGYIKRQMEECRKWICTEIGDNASYFEKLFCFKLLREFETRKKSKYKISAIKNGSYVESLYNKVLYENRFILSKKSKENGIVLYEKIDMYKFIATLIYAYKSGKIREFLDVPDVFYIMRQLKETGLEPYLEHYFA